MPHEGTFQLQTDLPSVAAHQLQSYKIGFKAGEKLLPGSTPGGRCFLSRGPCFCRTILPRGKAFDYLKKFPGGCWRLELTDALSNYGLLRKYIHYFDGKKVTLMPMSFVFTNCSIIPVVLETHIN